MRKNVYSTGMATKTDVRRRLKESAPLYLLLLPSLIILLLFTYYPMYGVVIAFKDFKPAEGILGSDWAGFKNFTTYFHSFQFKPTIRNTVVISLYTIAVTFPLPILVALMCNQMKALRYKKFFQVSTYAWSQDSEVGLNVNQFQVTEAIEGYDGTHYVEAATYYLDISDRELLITTKCENPEAVLRWADGFYDDLVALETFYGSVPGQISENADGTYTVLTPADGSSLDTSAWSNSLRDFGPKYMNPSFYGNVTLPSDQGDGIKLAQDSLNAKYVTHDRNTGMPMVQYSEDELSELSALSMDISSYVEQKYANWVTGVEDIDADWDAYIEQLNAMGLERYVEIQNQAYAVYLESMA